MAPPSSSPLVVKAKLSSPVLFKTPSYVMPASKRKLAPLRKQEPAPSKVEVDPSAIFAEAFSSENMRKLMNDEGPVVKAVLLLVSGEMQELTIDMSPKLKKVHETLKGSVTFLGQWESLECMLIINDALQKKAKTSTKNNHTLQPPFQNAVVYGDILVTKSDEEGIPLDFTLSEYKNFQKLDLPEWEVSEDDDDDEEEVDNDDVDDDEADAAAEAEFIEALKIKLKDAFKDSNGRSPSKTELEDLTASLMKKMGGEDAGDEDEEEEDEEEEEEEEEEDEEEEEEKEDEPPIPAKKSRTNKK